MNQNCLYRGDLARWGQEWMTEKPDRSFYRDLGSLLRLARMVALTIENEGCTYEIYTLE